MTISQHSCPDCQLLYLLARTARPYREDSQLVRHLSHWSTYRCFTCLYIMSLPPPPPPPPTPQDDVLPLDILTLSKCRLTPQGVHSVAYHLTSHPLFADVPQARLNAMAMAFLAHGGVGDDNHRLRPDTLHPLHLETHRTGQATGRLSMRHGYIQLVMDLVRVQPTSPFLSFMFPISFRG